MANTPKFTELELLGARLDSIKRRDHIDMDNDVPVFVARCHFDYKHPSGAIFALEKFVVIMHGSDETTEEQARENIVQYLANIKREDIQPAEEMRYE